MINIKDISDYVAKAVARPQVSHYLWWAGLKYSVHKIHYSEARLEYDVSIYVQIEHEIDPNHKFQFSMGWTHHLQDITITVEADRWMQEVDDMIAENAMLAWALRSREMDGFIESV